MNIKKMKITDVEKLLKEVAIQRGLKMSKASDLQIILGILEERRLNVNKFYDTSSKKVIK